MCYRIYKNKQQNVLLKQISCALNETKQIRQILLHFESNMNGIRKIFIFMYYIIIIKTLLHLLPLTLSK